MGILNLSTYRLTAFPFIGCLALGIVVISFIPASAQRPYDTRFESWIAHNPVIKEIEVSGNSYFSDDKIKDRLYSKVSTFWDLLKSGTPRHVQRYSRNRDTLEIKYLYVTNGFINVRVSESYEVRLPDSSAKVIVSIDEGNQFFIDSVVFNATDSLGFYSELKKKLRPLKKGEPVDPIAINDVAFNLTTVYAYNGYPYARVQSSLDSTLGPRETKVIITGKENQLVHFGDLLIDTLKYYDTSLVTREITFDRGDRYSRREIIQSQKRLYETGLFATVNLSISSDTALATDSASRRLNPDFEFTAIERKPHFVTAKTGLGQDPQQDLIWDLSASWGKRNIFKSRRIETSFNSRFIIFTKWRPLSHSYQIRFTEPWFLGFRMPIILTGRFEPGVKSQLQPYIIQKWSVSATSRRDWSEQFWIYFGTEYENVDIYDIEPALEPSLREELGISERRKLFLGTVLDSRRDKFMPRSGSYTTSLAEYIGGFLGGDASFVHLEFSWARYQRTLGIAVYANRIKVGWVTPFGDSKDVPTTDRYYLGGANSLRGYEENSVGPRRPDGSNDGANLVGIFNQELRFPMIWKFWGTFFTDFGNGWRDFEDIKFNTILFSYGVGIQFISPAGPIRLDLGHRTKSRYFSEGNRLHFTILYAF